MSNGCQNKLRTERVERGDLDMRVTAVEHCKAGYIESFREK